MKGDANHSAKLFGHNASGNSPKKLNYLQSRVLEAATLVSTILSPIRPRDVVGTLMASEHHELVTGRSTVACAMKAIANRGYLVSVPGGYLLPPPKLAATDAKTSSEPTPGLDDTSGFLLPRKEDMTAGRAPTHRRRTAESAER